MSFLPGTRGKALDQSLLPPGTRPCPRPSPAWLFPDTCANREDGWEGSQVGALAEGRAVGLWGRPWVRAACHTGATSRGEGEHRWLRLGKSKPVESLPSLAG